MTKRIPYAALFSLLLVACQLTNATSTTTPTIETPATSASNSTRIPVTETPLKQTITPSLSTAAPSPTVSPTATITSTPTSMPTPIIQPAIHEVAGDMYETLLSIPVGGDSIIQYDFLATSIEGPIGIAVLPDDSFIIADIVANRLLRYDRMGTLMDTIELGDLGIRAVQDIRVNGEELYLLQMFYENYQVHQLSLDGELIASHEIPHRFPIGLNDIKIENALTGIAIDCEDNILLELMGGAVFFHLADVQTKSDPARVTRDYFCNGKRYQRIITSYGPIETPMLITDGNVVYETHLTSGMGGFTLMDAFQEGSFYVIRSERSRFSPGITDMTVHYIGPDGIQRGVARIPHSEFYYYPSRRVAIDSRGEVFVLLPRAESLDIVRLNFYEQLDPLIPGAVIPHVSIRTW